MILDWGSFTANAYKWKKQEMGFPLVGSKSDPAGYSGQMKLCLHNIKWS